MIKKLFLFFFFSFLFIALLLEAAGGWRGEKLQRQPPAPFFILNNTIQIYMHIDSKHYSFLKPTTPEGCAWPIKMQQMPGPKQNFG